MLNCWQVKGCGREPGGPKASELGVCAAARETRLMGVHRGQNGGRACWAVAGTLCGGKVQGTFAAKLDSCSRCNFYAEVSQEEGSAMVPTRAILAKLK